MFNKQGHYSPIQNEIISALKTVYDPEIPVNVFDLGLIYDIQVDDAMTAHIKMTVTAPNCPAVDFLPIEIKNSLKAVERIKDTEITIVFDPPWSKDMISDTAMLELGLL